MPDKRLGVISLFARCKLAALMIALGMIAMLGGCALFDSELFWGARKLFSVDDFGAQPTETKKLPNVPLPPNGICLDVTIAERSIGDPLLGSQLWNDIEQVGVVPLETQDVMLKHGFRIGHTGSKPPRVLEQLLGMQSELDGAPGRSAVEKMMTRRMVIPAGAEREIQTSEVYPECSVEVPLPEGVPHRNYQNARCVLKITPCKLQDNWIRVDFLPEIHYGEDQYRRMVVGGAWQGRTSQEIEPLYPLRFSVDLNLGEMAVISGQPTEKESIGQHFFCVRADENWKTQRVLVLRFSNMSRAKSVYAEN